MPFVKRISIVFAALFLGLGFARAKKNVVLIIADDLNDCSGAYGHPLVHIPNIDRLAAEGMLFENACCQFPSDAPSRISLMSGLYPAQTGLYTMQHRLREAWPKAITLGQQFIKNDYAVGRVGQIFYCPNPKDIGTDGYDNPDS